MELESQLQIPNFHISLSYKCPEEKHASSFSPHNYGLNSRVDLTTLGGLVRVKTVEQETFPRSHGCSSQKIKERDLWRSLNGHDILKRHTMPIKIFFVLATIPKEIAIWIPSIFMAFILQNLKVNSINYHYYHNY